MAVLEKHVQLFFIICLTLETGKEKSFLFSFLVHVYVAVKNIETRNFR